MRALYRTLCSRASPIRGTVIAEQVLEGVRKDVASLQSKHGITPGLAVIVVGGRKDSLKYVQKKQDMAEGLGLRSFRAALPADATAESVRTTIERFNADPSCDGILLQLPLPAHLPAHEMLLAIDPTKDADGFHPMNAGRLASWRTATLTPCTPRGVVHMLRECGVGLAGKHVAVVGESNVVGLPLALMLLGEKATLTIVHKDTPDPAKLTSQADIIVSAAGVAGLIKADWVKPGAVVVDVGINFAPDESGRIRMCGDVAPDVWDVASHVSPVPGGVGPMTVAMLMRNTVDACLLRTRFSELLSSGAQNPVEGCVNEMELDAGCASWLDTDGDGVISLDELRAVFGDELTETQLLELLSKADQDGDGVVTPADVNEAARKVRERQ